MNNELEELAVTTAQAKKMVELIKVTLMTLLLQCGSAGLGNIGKWGSWDVDLLLIGEQACCKTLVTLAKTPAGSCSSSLLLLMASLVASVCNLRGGLVHTRSSAGPCSFLPWFHGVLVPFGPCAKMSLHCWRTPDVGEQ